MSFTVIEGVVIPVDANGKPLPVADGAAVGTTSGSLVAGSDGTDAHLLRMATDGTVRVDPTGTTTQPVSDGGGSLTVDGTVSVEGTVSVSGPVTVEGSVTIGSPVTVEGSVSVSGPATVTGTITANIGTTGGLALDSTLTGGGQRVQVTDGSNNAAVKGATMAAGGSDPALVVGLSPNSPLPAGTNILGPSLLHRRPLGTSLLRCPNRPLGTFLLRCPNRQQPISTLRYLRGLLGASPADGL